VGGLEGRGECVCVCAMEGDRVRSMEGGRVGWLDGWREGGREGETGGDIFEEVAPAKGVFPPVIWNLKARKRGGAGGRGDRV